MSAELPPELSVASLRALAAALRDGPLAIGRSRQVLEQLAGPYAEALAQTLAEWSEQGMSPRHAAIVVEAVATTKARSVEPGALLDLVLSGPEVPGVPTGDTAATMHALVAQAEAEVLLVGYAVHNGQRVFAPVAERMAERPDLEVTLCLDTQRAWGDETPSSVLLDRFGREFREKHWPWARLPRLYHDPRSLSLGKDQRSCLHAKCVVVDRRIALITSANFTEAAQHRNIEVGVVVRHAPVAERLAAYFHGLMVNGLLVPCPLRCSDIDP